MLEYIHPHSGYKIRLCNHWLRPLINSERTESRPTESAEKGLSTRHCVPGKNEMGLTNIQDNPPPCLCQDIPPYSSIGIQFQDSALNEASGQRHQACYSGQKIMPVDPPSMLAFFKDQLACKCLGLASLPSPDN